LVGKETENLPLKKKKDISSSSF